MDVVAALVEPLTWLARPDKRIFAGYLATSALLALWVFRRRRRPLAHALSVRVFLHRSALLDLRLIAARALLGGFGAPRVLASVGLAISIASALDRALGSNARTTHPSALVIGLFTLVSFLADDLTSFLVHRAMHRVPALWELHQVHHSAEVMTPLTVYRVHPLEGWINQARGALTTGLVAGAFVHFAPGPLHALTIAGVEIFGLVFSLCGANLRHSHVRLSFGPALEHVFISPAMHQLHHGRAPEQHHMNFGSALAIWDWIAGSLRVSSPSVRPRFGLPARARNHHPARLASVLFGPLAALARPLSALFAQIKMPGAG